MPSTDRLRHPLPGIAALVLLAPVLPAAEEGALTVSEFAPTGMVGSVVGITTDPQGRVYVTNTNRRTYGALDIRQHTDWLYESLACTSIADKRALIHRRMPDWQKLEHITEQVIRVEDSDGDGKADKRSIAFDGFGTDINGVAAGILWYDNALYVTSYPSLYRLTDPDGDGVFDKVEELATGFGIHVGYGGHDMHGPTLGMDGRIYWSQGDKGFNVTAEGKNHYFPGQGGVFRIEPDGTGFEVFCHGVRNPEELTFDDFGNLFTVDNDGDMGDKERFENLVDGADLGWRAWYQYREGKHWADIVAFNPWMADHLWQPEAEGQPAYLTPGLDNYSDGPVGFKHNPGTALNARYHDYFFLAESSKKVSAFRAVPHGASFRMANPEVVLTGPFTTGIYFAPDGALCLADWGDNPWLPHTRGRVLKLDDPAHAKDPARLETAGLIRAGMAGRPGDELVKLLDHADQRVRIAAQIALAKQGAEGLKLLTARALQPGATRPGRVHAIWGVGMVARRAGAAAAAQPLLPLLADPDVEVRAHTARVLGEAGLATAAPAVAGLLADPEPRARLFAGIALARIGGPAQFAAAVAMLAANDNADPFVRHGGVMALDGCAHGDHAPLLALTAHASRAVRLAAVVALRHAGDPEVARFLADPDPLVVGEAARAIHDDLSIPAALPALARLLERAEVSEDGSVRRAISANLRLGDAAAAARLAAYAARAAAPAVLRAEAIDSLAWWGKPLILDRVQATYRGLPARDPAVAVAALGKTLEALLLDKHKPVQGAAAHLIAQLKLTEWISRVTALANDAARDDEVRAIAFNAMDALAAPEVDATAQRLLQDPHAALRGAALAVIARRAPTADGTFAALQAALASAELRDRQQAVAVLGTLTDARAQKLSGALLDDWKAGTLAPGLRLDVADAVRAQKAKPLVARLDALEKGIAKDAPLGLASLALEGGDAEAGAAIFKGGAAISCLQCHTLGAGNSVGPDLQHVASRLDRAHLLSSMIDPQADIAEGFGMITLTLSDGGLIAGVLVGETADALKVRGPAGGEPQVVPKAKIAQRGKVVSVMPPIGQLLSRGEIRNLVAFLATLK